MVTVRRFATTFDSSTPTGGAGWTNLNYLNDDDSNYATCENITAESSQNNKPGMIFATGFNFSIPEGALINSIRVGYNHYCTGGINIAAPLIKILGGYGSAYGNSVPTTSTNYTIFKENKHLLVSEVNKPSFGVSIEYPANTNSKNGDLLVGYIWIEIDYTLPTYFLSCDVSNTNPATGEEFNLVLNLRNTNNTNNGFYQTNVDITLPTGISFVEKVSGEGIVSTPNGNLVWSTLLTNNPSQMIIKLKAIGETGTYSILCNERTTSVNVTNNININAPVLIFDVGCKNQFINLTKLTNNEYTFTITANSTSKPKDIQSVILTFPEGWDLIQANCLTEGDNFLPGTEVNSYNWSINLSNGFTKLDLKIKLPSTPGQQTLNLNGVNYVSYILDPKYTTPFYSCIKLDEDTIEKLAEGVKYTVATYIKVLERDNTSEIYKGEWNYRFGICQNSTFDISKCVFSDMIETKNKYVKKELDFTYDGTPIYLVWTGGYVENNPEKIDILFTEPCIVEKSDYTGLIERSLFPKPLKNLLNDVNTAYLVLPSQTSTGKIRFSNINFSGFNTLDGLVIHEILMNFYLKSNLSSLFNVILNLSGDIQNKTENIPPSDEIVTIGDDSDTWNLINLQNYTDLYFDLVIKNPYDYPITLDMRDFELEFLYIEDANLNAKGFSINGEQCQFYGLFLEDRDLGHGVNSNVKEHREEGSDYAIEYLMNVKEKTINLTCVVTACNHDEAVILIDKFVKLASNERDKNNKPIYKQLRLDDMPGRYWNYIIKKEIEDNFDNGVHTLKIEFVIPEGCAFSDNLTVTGAIGKINSIEKVNPIILLKALTSQITLNETVSNQSLIIRNNSIISGDIIRIDCQKRTVEKIVSDTVADITSSVDLNSDFFSLMGKYMFDAGTTGTIQSVTYREAL